MDHEGPPQIAPVSPAPDAGSLGAVDGPRLLTRSDWVQLGIGFGIAVVFMAVPILNWICSYLSILVHELGHWLAGMLFGYPSVPAFDLRQGGGLTLHQERSTFTLICVYVVALLPFIWLRRNRLGMAVWGGVLVFFALVTHTRLHEWAMILSGHGTEVLIAGVFLYRAWANAAINTSSERPLYAALGLFMSWHVIGFAWRVLYDVDARADYFVGKIDCDNDLVRIASLTGISMNAWLWLLIFGASAAVAVSFLAFRYQETWRGWVWRLIEDRSA
jgi:hypothetical protein